MSGLLFNGGVVKELETKKEHKLTIGADPEFFVYSKKEKTFVPACTRFGGEKRAPVFLSPDGGFLEDGTTVEFNLTPSPTLQTTKDKLLGLLRVFLNKYDNYTISPHSNQRFSIAELDKFPEAMHIGCSPDMFAYGLRIAPTIARFGGHRFAGGHIHVGIDPWPEGLVKQNFIQFLDLLIGAPMACAWGDKYRYPFYGHLGLYRETNYGIEYRTPDNTWCNPTRATSTVYTDTLIQSFDWLMDKLVRLCNYDGHGGRVNDDIRKYVSSTGLKARMNNLGTLQSPDKLAEWSDSYRNCRYHIDRWVSARRSPPAFMSKHAVQAVQFAVNDFEQQEPGEL